MNLLNVLFGTWNFTIKRIVDHLAEQKKISQFLTKSIKFIEVQDFRNSSIYFCLVEMILMREKASTHWYVDSCFFYIINSCQFLFSSKLQYAPLNNQLNLYKDIWGYSQGKSTLNMDLDIWVAGTLNQLIVRDSYTEIEISKK